MNAPQNWFGLKDTIADWMARDDLPLPAIVGMAEGELRTVLPPICPDLPGLDAERTTNWLLAAHPDVYLAASMAEANDWLNDRERATYWRMRVLSKIHGPFAHGAEIVEKKPSLWERFWRWAVVNARG